MTPPASYITVTLILLFAIACVRWIRGPKKPSVKSNDEIADDYWWLYDN